MKIAYIYPKGRLDRVEQLAEGSIPSDFFYGSHELKQKGHEVDLFEFDGEYCRNRFVRFIGQKLYALCLLPARARGELLENVRARLPELRKYDVIVAIQSSTALALAIWSALGLIKVPIVAIHCGFQERAHTRFQKRITSFLLRRIWSQVFGEGEIGELKRLFAVPEERLMVNQYGVDLSFWTPGKVNDSDRYVFALGNDVLRDYETLVRAALKIDCKVLIVTRKNIEEKLPPNVELVQGSWHGKDIDDSRLREMYRQSLCVIVPLLPGYKPSGQSVTLQAMACGKPVVLSRTAGLWNKEGLKDGENVILIEPCDKNALSNAVNTVISDSDIRNKLGAKGRAYVEKEGSICYFADRMEAICKKVIGRES